MATNLPPRILTYVIRYTDGTISFFVGDAPCWTIQRSFDLSGPWHDLLKGDGTIPVTIADPGSSGPAYYRVVERKCGT
jgi:hypothetical protein